jgi:transposase
MEVLYPRCAGLDIHKDLVVGCVRISNGPKRRTELQTFGTTTSQLLALSDWLHSFEVTHVAMEATGVYWKPVWHVLEGEFTLVLANAAHIRNVPGRKTDANDATWIADLLAHGLIRGSFVPPAPIQEIRDLTRMRKQLVRGVAQHTLRIQKVLEDANLKIASVISDVLGMSGRKILDAIVAGQCDPERLADLAVGKVKATRPVLVEALRGFIKEHHRFLIRSLLRVIDALRQEIASIEQRMGQALDPFRTAATALTSIPGVSTTVATTLIAEIGVDMTRFPSAGHLVSWAGLCPRNDESAGKRRSTRLRHGAPWLKTALVQAAWAASRRKDSYLRAQFFRLRARRGPKKAIVAVAASILTAAYHMLRHGVDYIDLGADYFDRLDQKRTVSKLIRRLQALGVELEVRKTG